MRKVFAALLVLLSLQLIHAAQPTVGDTFFVSAGYGTIMGSGSTNATEILDSFVVRGDTTFYYFTIIDTENEWFVEFGRWAHLIDDNHSRLAVLDGTPSCIQEHSSRFDNLRWILSDKSTLLFYYSIRSFAPLCPIPIDSSDAPFSEEDYFIVRHSDTTGVKWAYRPDHENEFEPYVMIFEDGEDSTGKSRAVEDLNALTPITMWVPSNPGYDRPNPIGNTRILLNSDFWPIDFEELEMGFGAYWADVSYKPVSTAAVRKHTGTIHPMRSVRDRPFIYTVRGRRVSPEKPFPRGVYIMGNKKGSYMKRINIGNERDIAPAQRR
ncbi:MAG: hypothetical protein ACOC41_03380 [Chitinivibrionales bacterium]